MGRWQPPFDNLPAALVSSLRDNMVTVAGGGVRFVAEALGNMPALQSLE